MPHSPEEMALAVYKAYPRKVGKQDALKAIHKAAKVLMKAGSTERDAYATLYRAVTAYAKSGEVTTRERQYIPHAATWFNKGRWEDDPAEWEVGKSENQKISKPVEGLWEAGWQG